MGGRIPKKSISCTYCDSRVQFFFRITRIRRKSRHHFGWNHQHNDEQWTKNRRKDVHILKDKTKFPNESREKKMFKWVYFFCLIRQMVWLKDIFWFDIKVPLLTSDIFIIAWWTSGTTFETCTSTKRQTWHIRVTKRFYESTSRKLLSLVSKTGIKSHEKNNKWISSIQFHLFTRLNSRQGPIFSHWRYSVDFFTHNVN